MFPTPDPTSQRRVGAIALVALAAAGLGLSVTASSATHPLRAAHEGDRAGERGRCDHGAYRPHRFAVEVEKSSIRELVVCTDERGVELAVTAHSLALGLVAAADGPAVAREAQLAALTRLRSMRARVASDPALDADQRAASLARIDQTIEAIRNDLAD